MARARNIKPGFFTNDVLGELAPLARLLFAGLWTLCDREGRVQDRPKKIKAEVLPYDDCDADALLQDLHNAGFILRYTAGDVRLIQVLKWAEHQNPHVKEAPSTLPAPDKHGASTVLEQGKASPEPERAGLIPDSGFLIPDTSAPAAPPPTVKKKEAGYPEAFEAAWGAYPPRSGRSKPDAFKAWSARVKEGADPQSILAGAKRYAAYVRANSTEDKYIKQPATFFGPGLHFQSEWAVSGGGATTPTPKQPDDAARYLNDDRTSDEIKAAALGGIKLLASRGLRTKEAA